MKNAKLDAKTKHYMKQVVFLTRLLTHYRTPFHEAVRHRLAAHGIAYRVVYGAPTTSEASKGDLADLSWGEPTKNYYAGRGKLVWQKLPHLNDVDLMIIGQENKNLHNYALQLLRYVGGPRLAFFGHGRNFQATGRASFSECFKRFWLTRVDWWFAYTENSANIVEKVGFPRNQITIFNNTIDTSRIRNELNSIAVSERERLRHEVFQGSQNIGIYIGGLYELKRIPFLLEAAEKIRSQIPDFHLVIIGGGDEAQRVRSAAANHKWIHALGPKFGREKTLFASLGRVFLMPGLVGLSVMDAFAYGLPMVTTAVSYHSPEIDYLKDGQNGVIVQDVKNSVAYADAIVRILQDQNWHRMLCLGAEEALSTYTVDAMANSFSDGVLQALEYCDVNKM